MNWSVSLFKAIWGYGCVTDRAKNPRRRAGGAFQVVIFVVLVIGGMACIDLWRHR